MTNDPPEAKPIRDAASVILVRERGGTSQVEIFMLRRHRKSSFMGSAFVFPGGTTDPGETDLRFTAARELFEEAGVLIADQTIPQDTLTTWRDALNGGTRTLTDMLSEADAAVDAAKLHYFSHWITPSIERKRFSARFFVAALPPGQTPTFDDRETVEEVWVTPQEALADARDMRLPPPQVRTLGDLIEPCRNGLAGVFADADARAGHKHALMPRMCPLDAGFALLLPWDPDYETRGTGDLLRMPKDHPLAVGPSRFILEDTTWKNLHAPDSPAEG